MFYRLRCMKHGWESMLCQLGLLDTLVFFAGESRRLSQCCASVGLRMRQMQSQTLGAQYSYRRKAQTHAQTRCPLALCTCRTKWLHPGHCKECEAQCRCMLLALLTIGLDVQPMVWIQCFDWAGTIITSIAGMWAQMAL